MKSRSSLFLMELVIVILFFSLTSAVCMSVFAGAKKTTSAARDLRDAAVEAQTCAECFKAADGNLAALAALTGGTVSGDTLGFSSGDLDIVITASAEDGLIKADITVFSGDNAIFETAAAVPEVSGHE